jgi:Fe-S oxidoreductase
MQAMMNIEVWMPWSKKIVTACPHCFNSKKWISELGGKYEVIHHTEFLKSLLDDGRLTIEGGQKGERITFHDPCYLGELIMCMKHQEIWFLN